MDERMKITDKIEIERRRRKEMNDHITLKGDVVLERRTKDGKVIDREELKNLVVNVGKERVARLINGTTLTGDGAFGYIAIGEGDTGGPSGPAVGDTALEAEVAREASANSYEASYKSVFEHTFQFDTAESYSIVEAGVFDEASTGTMLDRFTFSAKAVDGDTDLYVKITITVA